MRRLLIGLLFLLLAVPGWAQIRFYPLCPIQQKYGVGDLSSSSISYAPAPGWYVDSVNGNDTNTGRSAGQAYQTIAQLLTQTIPAGSTICLARGSTWREQLTVPVDNLTVAAYGTGAKPLLDASDVIAAGSWSKTGGLTNVYQAGVIVAAGGSTQVWAWEDDVRLARQTAGDTAAVDATSGSMCVSADANGAQTLYVHATNSTNPGTNGKRYEFSARKQGLDSVYSNTTYIGLHARRGNNSDGPIRAGARYARIHDCLSEESYSHLYYFQGGAVVSASTAHGGGSSLFVGHDPGAGAIPPITVTDCTAYNDSYLQVRGASAYLSHTGGWPNAFESITLQNFTSYNLDGGIGVNEVTAAIVLDATITCSGACIQAAHGSVSVNGGTITVSYPDVSGNDRVFDSQGAVAWTIRDATLTSSQVANLFYTGTAGTSLDMESSSWIATTSAGVSMPASCSIRSYYNTFNMSPTYPVWSNYVAPLTLDSDYNAFTNANQPFRVEGTLYLTVAAYKAGTGQDANSTP